MNNRARRATPKSAPDSVSRKARRLRRRLAPPRSGGGHPALAPAGRRRRPPPFASRAARRRFAAPRPRLAVPLLGRFAPSAGAALACPFLLPVFLPVALSVVSRLPPPRWSSLGLVCRALPGVFICWVAASSSLRAVTDCAVTRLGPPPHPRRLRGPPPLVGVPRVPRPSLGGSGFGTAVSLPAVGAFLSAAAIVHSLQRRQQQPTGSGSAPCSVFAAWLQPQAAAPATPVPLLPPYCRCRRAAPPARSLRRRPFICCCRRFRSFPMAPALPRASVVVFLMETASLNRPAPDPRGRSFPSDTHDRPTHAVSAPCFARRPMGGKPPL